MKANRTVRDFEVALMNLLLTTSFERITVDQICDEALLHRSSFYRYFHDKYDLLEQALGAWVERIVDQTATEDDLIEALVSQIEANRAMFSNLANGGMRSSFSAELVRMIADTYWPGASRRAKIRSWSPSRRRRTRKCWPTS